MSSQKNEFIKKEISEIKNLYFLINKINSLQIRLPKQAIELARSLAQDEESFTRIFATPSEMDELLQCIAGGEVKDILFRSMLSESQFTRMFPDSRRVSGFVSYLSQLKKNVHQHPQLDILAIDHYLKLFKEKVCSLDSLQRLASDKYDIETLITIFPDIKEILADKIKLLKSKPKEKEPLPTFFESSLYSNSISDASKAALERKNTAENFLQAVKDDNFSKVKSYLLQGVDVNNDIYGYPGLNQYFATAIEEACRRGLLNMVKLLVSKGANLKYTNKFGYTLLHAASASGNKELVNYLLEKNCIDVNAKSLPEINGREYTAFDIAVIWKYPEIIETLEKHGGHWAIDDNKDITSMHF